MNHDGEAVLQLALGQRLFVLVQDTALEDESLRVHVELSPARYDFSQRVGCEGFLSACDPYGPRKHK